MTTHESICLEMRCESLRNSLCKIFTHFSESAALMQLSYEDLCAFAKSNMEKIVSTLIVVEGIHPHLRGYQYIRAAILRALEDPQFLDNLSMVSYPTIAEQFHTKPACVERAIRHALTLAWEQRARSSSDVIYRTNREFLVSFTETIRLQFL